MEGTEERKAGPSSTERREEKKKGDTTEKSIDCVNTGVKVRREEKDTLLTYPGSLYASYLNHLRTGSTYLLMTPSLPTPQRADLVHSPPLASLPSGLTLPPRFPNRSSPPPHTTQSQPSTASTHSQKVHNTPTLRLSPSKMSNEMRGEDACTPSRELSPRSRAPGAFPLCGGEACRSGGFGEFVKRGLAVLGVLRVWMFRVEGSVGG